MNENKKKSSITTTLSLTTMRFYSLPIKKKLVARATTPQAIDLYFYLLKLQEMFLFRLPQTRCQ